MKTKIRSAERKREWRERTWRHRVAGEEEEEGGGGHVPRGQSSDWEVPYVRQILLPG